LRSTKNRFHLTCLARDVLFTLLHDSLINAQSVARNAYIDNDGELEKVVDKSFQRRLYVREARRSSYIRAINEYIVRDG